MHIDIYVDASSFDNGIAKYGYIILLENNKVAEGSGYYDGAFSSSSAENIAADTAFRFTKLACRKLRLKIDSITLYTDYKSMLIDGHRPRHLKASLPPQNGDHSKTIGYHIPIRYEWIPSESNPADKLVSPQRNGAHS